MSNKVWNPVLVSGIFSLVLAGCGGNEVPQSNSPTTTVNPQPTSAPSASPSPTATPAQTPVGSPAPSAAPTISPQPTAGPSANPSPTAAPTQTPMASPTPSATPGVSPTPDAQAKNIYNVANACWVLKSNDVYVGRVEDDYGRVGSIEAASPFFLKPSRLGQYLLLSDYQRAEGAVGSKQLLGISDPLGEFLDDLGELAVEAGFLVRGIADIADYFVDPALASQRIAQDIADGVIDGAGLIGDSDVTPGLATSTRANDLALWDLVEFEPGSERFFVRSNVTGLNLHLDAELFGLSSDAGEAELFELLAAEDCVEYPEVSLNLSADEAGPAIYLNEVSRFAEMGFDGNDIFGYVDTHAHISAYEFIGGRINYGDPFHKFGIDHALEDCEVNHGPNGITGFVEAVTTDPTPHETQGWPTFPYWPVNNSLQHHQTYYRWIERSYYGGLRVLVNPLVHNEILCQLNPQKQNDCDAMPAIILQAELMHDMQNYIDAQHGGPGEGWFRIVTSPVEAREVIADGKMAVILSVEMSKLMNCGEFLGVAECSEEEIVERMDTLGALGVRSLFPVHKFDNALGGHLPDLGNPVGIAGVLYAGNLGETGHTIEYEVCPDDEYSGNESDQEPELSLDPLGIIDQMLFQMDYLGETFPDAPEGFDEFDPRRGTEDLCNSRGLTGLGEFLVEEMMRRGWLIETDHISRKAAARVLELTVVQDYPVINSHGGWGGTQALRNRIAAQGGFSNAFSSVRNGLLGNLLENGRRPRSAEFKVGPYGASGFGTDVNGIASLPGHPGDTDIELYPFTSVDGRVTFDVQKTGDHEFGLYSGRGVAHYGLYPDVIADMMANHNRTQEELDEALGQLFTSAEAYLRMWERAASGRDIP